MFKLRKTSRQQKIEKYISEQEVKALSEDYKPHKESHETKIFKALKKAGKHGAYNFDLAKPNVGGICWHRRITDMRKDGIVIKHVQITNTIHKYFLEIK